MGGDTVRWLPCREQQGPTIDDALEDLQEMIPDSPAASSQQAGMSKPRGLQALQPVRAWQLTV